MRLIKRMFSFLAVLFVLMILSGVFCIFYAFKIEPYRLKVNEYTLNRTEESTEKVKIVQFSDLHIKADFTYESLEKVVKEINGQKPDIVVFTGDLYDNYAVYNDDINIVEQLSNIKAEYAKIAVWGNHDYGGGAVRQYENVMEQAGFTVLKNENWYVTLESGKKILFTGLDDSLLGDPYMNDSTKLYDSDFEILLSHEPDGAGDYQGYGYDLMLSGHSHGGQVNIPFLPWINETALSVANLTAEHRGGMYDLNSEDTSKLYINTGIGTTHISARFGVVPEVAVFDIYII